MDIRNHQPAVSKTDGEGQAAGKISTVAEPAPFQGVLLKITMVVVNVMVMVILMMVVRAVVGVFTTMMMMMMMVVMIIMMIAAPLLSLPQLQFRPKRRRRK